MISAPWYNNSSETLAFNAYADRQSRIEKAISIFCGASKDNLQDYYYVQDILDRCGCSVTTSAEQEYINNEVNKRWHGPSI